MQIVLPNSTPGLSLKLKLQPLLRSHCKLCHHISHILESKDTLHKCTWNVMWVFSHTQVKIRDNFLHTSWVRIDYTIPLSTDEIYSHRMQHWYGIVSNNTINLLNGSGATVNHFLMKKVINVFYCIYLYLTTFLYPLLDIVPCLHN